MNSPAKKTYVISGAASGIGQATAGHLRADGHRVIGIDLAGTDVSADLGTPGGRAEALAALDGEPVDGLVPFAGLAAATGRPGGLIVSVNYFGAVALAEGLTFRAGGSVVLVSSNSATAQPNWPVELADACLAGDETAARALADEHGPINAYPASKAALAWYARMHAPEWIKDRGVRLNAIAPGLIETPMTDATRTDPLTAEGMKLYPVPAARGGRPGEIAALAAFLLGGESSFLVGSVVFADGGTDALLRPRDWPAVWRL